MKVGTSVIHSFWNVATWIGMRRLGTFLQRVYPSAYADTVFFKDTIPSSSSTNNDNDKNDPEGGGIIGLTIDDGLARNPDCSMVDEVCALLKAYNAHATFFVCTDYMSRAEDIQTLLSAKDDDDNNNDDTNYYYNYGKNEFGNHLQEDRSGYYSRLSKESFRQALQEANRFIENECYGRVLSSSSYHSSPPKKKTKWFRAPQGVMTASMNEVIKEEGMIHVLGDCYCDDWAFAEAGDTSCVAPLMLKQVQTTGSIAIFHMPERGFREASLQALQEFLEGTKERGIRCVSLSELMMMKEKNVDTVSDKKDN